MSTPKRLRRITPSGAIVGAILVSVVISLVSEGVALCMPFLTGAWLTATATVFWAGVLVCVSAAVQAMLTRWS